MKFMVICLFSLFTLNVNANHLLTHNGQEVDVQATTTDVDVLFHITDMDKEISKEIINNFPLVLFEDLRFTQLKTTNDVGEASLPYYSIIVRGRPNDFQISYSLGEAETITNISPTPTLPQVSRCDKPACTAQRDNYKINWSLYNKGLQHFYKKEFLGRFRNLDLTRITMYPVQYDGSNSILRLYSHARFHITRQNVKKIDLNTLVMPEDIIRQADLNNRFVILTPKKFTDTLTEFVDWKTQMGYEVSVYTLEEIGSSTSAIKSFLTDLYSDETTKFTYALLIGHEGNFPTFKQKLSSGWWATAPSDLQYFTFDGKDDYIPDIFYGRFTADTTEDLQGMIAKTIEYESQNYNDASGLERIMGMASNEGTGPTDVEYIHEMLGTFVDGLFLEPTYFLQQNSDSTPTNLNAIFSNGVGWVNYIGHGSGTSWPSQSRAYKSSEIKNIDSHGKVKPIIIDVACQNGNFSYGKGKLGVTFMNARHNGEPSGAVAYYGGSVNISWDPPAIMAIGINRMVATHQVEHLGEALLAGQLFLSNNYTNIGDIKDNYIWYHLQGDPSLKLNY